MCVGVDNELELDVNLNTIVAPNVIVCEQAVRINDSHFRCSRRGAHGFRTHEWLTYSSLRNEQVDRLTVSVRDSMRRRR